MANISTSEDISNEIEWVDTDTAIGVLISVVILCLIGEFLWYLLIKEVQRTDSDLLTGKLFGYFAIVNMISLPIIIVLIEMIGFLPIHTIFGNWFCFITAFTLHFYNTFIAIFSFMVTCFVYIGFVHENITNHYGKEFIRDRFCALCLIIPLIISTIIATTSFHQSVMSTPPWIDKCYGRQSNMRGAICYFHDSMLQEKYGSWSYVAEISLQCICWFEFLVTIIMVSNIPEAILYLLIYAHLIRYV